MYTIQVHLQCIEKFLEILPNDVEYTELVVENLVSHILLDFFTEVIIDDISINFAPNSSKEEQLGFIRIQAQCLGGTSHFLPQNVENMELALEDSISCALVELLGAVNVGEIKLLPSEEMPTLP